MAKLLKFLYSEEATQFEEILHLVMTLQSRNDVKVQRADLTCDVIKKLAPFVLSKPCTVAHEGTKSQNQSL